MAKFLEAYELIMYYEGGYSNDPDDVGGETYKGVARNYYPEWKGWELIDEAKKDPSFPYNLKYIPELEDKVKAFFKKHYWNLFWGDRIPSQSVANELFDIAVNMGVYRAVKFLQIALNVLNRNGTIYDDIVEDGFYGYNTHTALINYLAHDNDSLLVKVLNVLQGMHYIEYCRKSPTQEKFMRGWFKRVSLIK